MIQDWICGCCGTHNRGGNGTCANPQCGGEPISRSVDAVASPSPQRPAFFNRERQCITDNGVAKIAYGSFDDAHDAVLSIAQHQRKRCHAYRCLEHGWHVGSNRDAA